MKSLLWILVIAGLAGGCTSRGESRVRFGVQGNVEVLRPLLTVTATAGKWDIVVSGDEIRSSESFNHSADFRTPRNGMLLIETVVGAPGQDPFVVSAIELKIREDWVWDVDILITDENPFTMCFGCVGYEAFDLPDGLTSEPHDSLFIVWGGNWISNPVVY